MTIIKRNKRANFEYLLLKSFQAGIVLKGAEVKEIKDGHIELGQSYCRMKDDGLYLWNAVVSSSKYADIDSSREKKLLLHKKELMEIRKSLEQKGLTVIPIAIGIERGLVKVTISLARGKKNYDKRETEKKRDDERSLRSMALRGNRGYTN